MSIPSLSLEGKVAIVTGGGQGIGEGIVRCLAEEGADVAVVDYNGENARKVADEVKSLGRKALAIEADVTHSDEAAKAVRATLEFFGKIDILVNNVGGHSAAPPRTQPATFTDRGDEEWQGYYEQNLKSTVAMCRAVIPHFKKQHSGKIVNISSISGRLPDFGNMPYTVFKAGIISLTQALAAELGGDNVNVNCICPGHVYTPLWERGAVAMYNRIREALTKGEELPARFRRFKPEGIDIIEKLTPKEWWVKYYVQPQTPLGREQTPEDIGRAVVFFASEDAKNVTGQTLHVDGGTVMR
jgi:NAD(P)-dependent dehydrogenase (short-subunit alcohol dehydrogenase family)